MNCGWNVQPFFFTLNFIMGIVAKILKELMPHYSAIESVARNRDAVDGQNVIIGINVADTIVAFLKDHGVVTIGQNLLDATNLLIESADKSKPFILPFVRPLA